MWGVFVGMCDTGYVSRRGWITFGIIDLVKAVNAWVRRAFGNVSIKKNQFEMLHLVLGLLYLAENMWRKKKSIFQK